MFKRLWIPVTGTSWRNIVFRLVVLQIGLMLYGFAISFMVDADIGASPWDVLGLGVAMHTPFSFGVASVLISVVVLVLWLPLRQKFGLGSLLNGLTVGLWADVGRWFTVTPDAWWLAWLQFLFGMALLAWATAMYVSAGYGPGPRDGLMTGLTRVTKWPLWVVRTLLEITVVIIGFALGGPVWFGTVVFALAIGPLIQMFLPWWQKWMRAHAARDRRRLGEEPEAA
ncbi:membrane protein YczE [Agrococcus casei]|uniref:membrane protein YczE n=1 Tax=Agrococcus casei TaxID=343512 RepID=UPI003F8F265B